MNIPTHIYWAPGTAPKCGEYTIHGEPGFEPDHCIYVMEDGQFRYLIYERHPTGEYRSQFWSPPFPTVEQLLDGGNVEPHERRIFKQMVVEGRREDVYFRHPFTEE